MRVSRHVLGVLLAVATPAASLSAVAAAVLPAAAQAQSCGADYYRNSRGNCVPRPVRADRAPHGASAKCRDGTYSFSQSRRGTCSHHGGVAQWL